MHEERIAWSASEGELPVAADSGYLALIDRRMLERECLAHSLKFPRSGWRVLTFSNVQDCKNTADNLGSPLAVVFNTGSYAKEDAINAVAEMIAIMAPAPVLVLSEVQDINTVLEVIALGVKGYIPSSVSIDICIQAISLAIAGGRFIPASSVLAVREYLGVAPQSPASETRFTNRQTAIAEALRCGKANKDIASELHLCESTVKVHVRNVMRKLGASNRTEVACKLTR